MVNNSSTPSLYGGVTLMLRLYAGVAFGTVIAVGMLAKVAPRHAPDAAWVHAVIVCVFAVLLIVRWQRAVRGDRGALRAVRIITAVLLVANVVEACLGEFPGWMRVEMVGIALLMVACLALLARLRIRCLPGRLTDG